MIVVLDLILWGVMAIAYEVTDEKHRWRRRVYILMGLFASIAALIDSFRLADEIFYPIVRTHWL